MAVNPSGDAVLKLKLKLKLTMCGVSRPRHTRDILQFHHPMSNYKLESSYSLQIKILSLANLHFRCTRAPHFSGSRGRCRLCRKAEVPPAPCGRLTPAGAEYWPASGRTTRAIGIRWFSCTSSARQWSCSCQTEAG